VVVNSDKAQCDSCTDGDISKTSTLSADAKEFFPKNYQSPHLQDSYGSSLQFEEVRFSGA
jgi:hypothetical protein